MTKKRISSQLSLQEGVFLYNCFYWAVGGVDVEERNVKDRIKMPPESTGLGGGRGSKQNSKRAFKISAADKRTLYNLLPWSMGKSYSKNNLRVFYTLKNPEFSFSIKAKVYAINDRCGKYIWW